MEGETILIRPSKIEECTGCGLHLNLDMADSEGTTYDYAIVGADEVEALEVELVTLHEHLMFSYN